jgi:hypothetical protein
MSFLAPSDFTGKVAQSVNKFTEPKLQEYIDRYEPIYLRSLLGVILYDEFVSDLDTAPNITPASVPTSPRFTAIFQPFQIDESIGNGCQYISEGFKEMLKLFIMMEYSRDNQFVFGITGATSNNYSNSELLALSRTQSRENFNKGVKTWHAIQWYIDVENPNDYDYTNYNGQHKDFISWL